PNCPRDPRSAPSLPIPSGRYGYRSSGETTRGTDMTGWGVERPVRTAVPASPVAPTGVRTFMPPRSQGAEQRTERHAGRWGLRALVIGGLAGAAWLLTGAAAHAADRVPAPESPSLGASLLGSVEEQTP